jgi:hypothetical protein
VWYRRTDFALQSALHPEACATDIQIQMEQARHSHQNFNHQSPNNTLQPAMVHPQRYTTTYVMSHHGSVVSSVAPSARNSPPMQPMQPRVPVPGLLNPEPAHQYRMSADLSYARTNWPQPQPQVGSSCTCVCFPMMRWQQESAMRGRLESAIDKCTRKSARTCLMSGRS